MPWNRVAIVGSTRSKDEFVGCSTILSIKAEVIFHCKTRTVRVPVRPGSAVPEDTAGRAVPGRFPRSPDPNGVTPRTPAVESPVGRIAIVTGVGDVPVPVVSFEIDFATKSDYGFFFYFFSHRERKVFSRKALKKMGDAKLKRSRWNRRWKNWFRSTLHRSDRWHLSICRDLSWRYTWSDRPHGWNNRIHCRT